MPNYTENYHLIKPLGTEYYNVEDFNTNANIIDGALKAASESGSNLYFGVCNDNDSRENIRIIDFSESIIAKFQSGIPDNSLFIIKFSDGWQPTDTGRLIFTINSTNYNVGFDYYNASSNKDLLLRIDSNGTGIFLYNENDYSTSMFVFLGSSSVSYRQLSSLRKANTTDNTDYYIPFNKVDNINSLKNIPGYENYIDGYVKFNPKTGTFITKDISSSGNLSVMGTATISGNISSTGNVTFSKTLTVTQSVTAATIKSNELDSPNGNSIAIGRNISSDPSKCIQLYDNLKFIEGHDIQELDEIYGNSNGNFYSGNVKTIRINDTLSLRQIPSLETNNDAEYGEYYNYRDINVRNQYGELLSFLYFRNSNEPQPSSSTERNYSRERTILQIGNYRADVISQVSSFAHCIDILRRTEDYYGSEPWYGIRINQATHFTTDPHNLDSSRFTILLKEGSGGFPSYKASNLYIKKEYSDMAGPGTVTLINRFEQKETISVALKDSAYAGSADYIVDPDTPSKSFVKVINEIIGLIGQTIRHNIKDILIYPGEYMIDETIEISASNITIRGSRMVGKTILTTPDGNSPSFKSPIFKIKGSSQYVTIQDLTLTNGFGTNITHGNMIRIEEPTKYIDTGSSTINHYEKLNLLKIDNVIFINNDRSTPGSYPAFIKGVGAGIAITNCTFAFTIPSSYSTIVPGNDSFIYIKNANMYGSSSIIFSGNNGIHNYNTLAEPSFTRLDIYIEFDDLNTININNSNSGFNLLTSDPQL